MDRRYFPVSGWTPHMASDSNSSDYDVAVVGGGAAGLFAAIFAGRAGQRVLVLDGAKKLGAKILVAGGGRCNVTHYTVDPSDYAGDKPNRIRKVLRRFDVADTIEFFREQGVELKQEETGKLFPVTDKARTVLDALIRACEAAAVTLAFPQRVENVERIEDGFVISGEWGEVRAARVILATGGRALPKSGSDGHGYLIAESLGHRLSERIFPALVPLILPGEHPLRELSGFSLDGTLTVRASSNKVLHHTTHSILFTHFGLSGPGILDISRYWRAGIEEDAGATLDLDFMPQVSENDLDQALQEAGPKNSRAILRQWLSSRLVDTLLKLAEVDGLVACAQLPKADRKRLIQTCKQYVLPVQGDRGYTYAEVTMGGVPLEEVDLKTMTSRKMPGLSLVGEILDVDGRIGGFNFQWAWATGYIAGSSTSLKGD